MKNRNTVLLLLAVLLVAFLTAAVLISGKEKSVQSAPAPEIPAAVPAEPDGPAAPSDLADSIQPDAPEVVVPGGSAIALPSPDPVSVSAGSALYAYEGMVVVNNGGTVYSTGADVTNMGGTVFCNGGTVYNYGGKVYARAGTVFNHAGTVYNDGADIIVLPEDDSQESRIYGYYELKLAGYYEPYVTVEGVVNEPGAESMIISEDSVCRITPKEGWHIANAETTSGELVWNDADGSVLLMNVTGDTVLTLETEPA